MSAESWLKEFYPESAKAVVNAGASDLVLVKHALRKWRGLRFEMLKKHGLLLINRDIYVDPDYDPDYDMVVLTIDGDSCSLCCRHYDGMDCLHCPLAIARNGVTCDNAYADEMKSPYAIFSRNEDPEPMIKWLEQTEAMLEKGNK